MPETHSMDRRRAKRKDSSKELALVVDSGRQQILNHAFAVDLSLLGARVRTPLHLQPGQRVTVIPREGKKYAVASRVIWVNPRREGADAEAGLAFLEAQDLSSALLAELG
ncbi:MAG: PilZ domain-containing protein [Terriglobia bacterium]